jgi:hypothetical protein
MPLPPPVIRVNRTFLETIDEAAPGLVQGLYLHGSLGFGDFTLAHSDIDFVAVLARRPDQDDVVALAEAHTLVRERHSQLNFDGFHIVATDLAAPPAECPAVPYTLARKFHVAGRVEINPVTWHELAQNGITVRGIDLADLDIWTDDSVLRAYTHNNLNTFWRMQVEMLLTHTAAAALPEVVAWCVLGVSRLHHLLATGAMTSKSGAGRYALTAFGSEWHPIVRDALEVREDPDAPSAYAHDLDQRAADVAGFTAMVVETGVALGG